MSRSDESPKSLSQHGEASRRGKSGASFKPPKKADARFKKQLLRGAFEENLDLIQDQPLGTTRRKREQRWKKLRKWVLGSSGVLGLALGIIFLSSLAQGRSQGESRKLQSRHRNILVKRTSETSESGASESAISLRAASMLQDALPLGVRRIVIDPGHGGMDGGTSIKFGMVEKDITLDIGLRLAEELRKAGFQVIMTRSQDVRVSLAERASRANEAQADLFVSIHVNWLPKRNARGFETYYLGASDDPFLNHLAQQENLNSGYTLSDMRRFLDAIYSGARTRASKRLAEEIQFSLYHILKEDNPGVISRGVMQAPFVVLVATEMPAVLAEVACLSNDREARMLAIPSYRQHIADGLAQGISAFAESSGQAQEGVSE